MDNTPPDIQAAREKLKNKYKNARTGGKGTVRRKKKTVQKSTAQSDDKRLQAALKRLNLEPLQGIEHVNIVFGTTQEDLTAIRFDNPKVTAAPSANTFSIGGKSSDASVTELFSQGLVSQQTFQAVLTQLSMGGSSTGHEGGMAGMGSSMGALNNVNIPGGAGAGGGGGAAGSGSSLKMEEVGNDDEDIPTLETDDFEGVSESQS